MIWLLPLLPLAAFTVVALHWFGTVANAQAEETERLAEWERRLTEWATLASAHESGRCHTTAECVRNRSVFPVEVER